MLTIVKVDVTATSKNLMVMKAAEGLAVSVFDEIMRISALNKNQLAGIHQLHFVWGYRRCVVKEKQNGCFTSSISYYYRGIQLSN